MFRWLRRSGRAKAAPPTLEVPSTREASNAGMPASVLDARALAGIYARRFAGMAADKDTLMRVLADPPTWSNTIPLAGPPARGVTPSRDEAPAPLPAPIPPPTPVVYPTQPAPALPASVTRHAEPASMPDPSYSATRVLGPRLAHGGPPWDTILPR